MGLLKRRTPEEKAEAQTRRNARAVERHADRERRELQRAGYIRGKAQLSLGSAPPSLRFHVYGTPSRRFTQSETKEDWAKRLTPLTDGLAAILAKSASSASTKITLNWGEEVVGRYSGGGNAVRLTCTVQILDKSIPKVTAVRTFQGSSPPSQVLRYEHEAGPATGDLPLDQIKSWILSLRRVEKSWSL